MAQSGFTTGYSDKTYRPNASVNRGEMRMMLHRFEKFYSGANRGNGIVKEPQMHTASCARASPAG